MPAAPVRLLIEGRPGAGKTTALRRLSEILREARVPLSGFVTQELRQKGRRVGFEIENFAGERGTLAHVKLSGPARVGRYGVDLDTFERIALPALEQPREGPVLIDELGKMELASERFREAIAALLDQPVSIVATVHLARHPFTDAIKNRPGVEAFRLTPSNRDRLPRELAERLGMAAP